MPKRTPQDTHERLASLPTSQLVELLTHLSAGELEQAIEKSGGLRRTEIQALKPDGASGIQLDSLEKRAGYLLLRKARLAILGELSGAAKVLGGLAKLPCSESEALAGMSTNSIPPAPEGATIAGARQHALDAFMQECRKLLPEPGVMKQKRESALSLFQLAKDLDCYALAKEFREQEDRKAEEHDLQQLAKDLDMADIFDDVDAERAQRVH